MPSAMQSKKSSQQSLQPLAGAEIALVRNIVGRAGKVVERRNRRAQPGWAQPGGNGKVLVVRNGRRLRARGRRGVGVGVLVVHGAYCERCSLP